MECRARLIKKGLKHQLRSELYEAEDLFSAVHNYSRANPFFHMLSHFCLMSVAIQKKDSRALLEQAWLAGCAPAASTRFVIHGLWKKIR